MKNQLKIFIIIGITGISFFLGTIFFGERAFYHINKYGVLEKVSKDNYKWQRKNGQKTKSTFSKRNYLHGGLTASVILVLASGYAYYRGKFPQ